MPAAPLPTAPPPISFRATAAERELLAVACTALGYTRSELIRAALSHYLKSKETSRAVCTSPAVGFTSQTTAKQ